MRIIIFITLFITSCTTQQLRYKYSFPGQHQIGLPSDFKVSRIETEFEGPVITANGLDSILMKVKLFDRKGVLLDEVDPGDLSIRSSEEIVVVPFKLNDDSYQTELRAPAKTKDIKLQVEWQDQAKGKIVLLKTRISPARDKLTPIKHEFQRTIFEDEVAIQRGSKTPENMTEAFALSRKVSKNSSRLIRFEYPEQARQNLSMLVDDAPNELFSHTMHSVFMFFPRKNLPLFHQGDNAITVTLPTGEEMIFDKHSMAVTGGVFKAGEVDRSADRQKRHFPHLVYNGKGILLRANARGQSPQLGQFTRDKIDKEHGIYGAVDVLIINGTTGERCLRPKSDFWAQKDVNPILFKFPTDAEFNEYLKVHCGFGIPEV
jgi:hypothetical protein